MGCDKSQITSTKYQTNSILQYLNTKTAPCRDRRLDFGDLDLFGIWCLNSGACGAQFESNCQSHSFCCFVRVDVQVGARTVVVDERARHELGTGETLIQNLPQLVSVDHFLFDQTLSNRFEALATRL